MYCHEELHDLQEDPEYICFVVLVPSALLYHLACRVLLEPRSYLDAAAIRVDAILIAFHFYFPSVGQWL